MLLFQKRKYGKQTLKTDNSVFWNVKQWGVAEILRCLGGIYLLLNLFGGRVCHESS
jgi:hypothetical protein